MLERVISGGQTGADQGGLRAARTCGIPTDEWAPRGWQTEDGPCPALANFGLVEIQGVYPERTRANVRDSDATIWFGNPESPGGGRRFALPGFGKLAYLVIEGQTQTPDVVAWIEADVIHVLNVAGNRESTEPGIGERVEQFLLTVFRQMVR